MSSSSHWLLRLLTFLLPSSLHHLIGDLEEERYHNGKRYGAGRAGFRLAWHVFRSMPTLANEICKWNLLMLTHYLKTGLRVIRRHVSYSIINVIGLSAGMAVCLLILLFTMDQKSYDRFHKDPGSIYRITTHYKSPLSENPKWYATSPSGLAQLLQTAESGVEDAVGIKSGFRAEIWHNDEALALEGIFASPDFFEFFGFELLEGDTQSALINPGSILLTTETATRLFGGQNQAMGQTIAATGNRDYLVTGIVRAEPRSHIRFESIVSLSTREMTVGATETDLSWREDLNNSYTYARMDDETAARLESRFPDLISARFENISDDQSLFDFRAQPITSINLGTEHVNEIGMVLPAIVGYFLMGFAVVVMLTAGFNYVSLTVARSLNRSKEIGVRRSVGARQGSIFSQFLLESVLMAILALLFAFILLNWLLPHFNSLFLINMSQNQITIDLFSDFWIYGIFLGFSVLIGLLAGLYPARLFTKFEAISVVATDRRSGRLSRQTLRKVITIAQFSFALIFVITSIALIGQFRLMSQTDYGFNHEHIVNIALQDIPFERLQSLIEDDSDVVSIAASSKIPALGSTSGVRLRNDEAAEDIVAHEFVVNEGYIQTMGLSLMAGRNFDPSLASDSLTSVILGRSTVQALGFESAPHAVGSSVHLATDQPGYQAFTIIGVVDDFISNSAASVGDPVLLRYRPEQFRYAVVKVASGGISGFLPRLGSQWAGLGSQYAPKLEIFDEQLRQSPIIVVFGDFLKVFGLITVFSLLISCLGLLGMAMYSAQNRLKEIGIRKMLGSSSWGIVGLLSREYLWLISIAVLIAGPLAWLLNSFWLSQLSNSFSLTPALFATGIVGTTVVALATIITQTLKASRTDVVRNLKAE